MKSISILGSTGSIGRNTLHVVQSLQEPVRVVALAAGENWELLLEQILLFRPQLVSVATEKAAACLRAQALSCEILVGKEGLFAVATHPEANLVVTALTGTAGILPTASAIQAGKDIALANKEALVSAGSQIIALAKEQNVRILPVDSEHSALFQCLQLTPREDVERLILTASGGPFWKRDTHTAPPTLEEALAHPTYRMGKKITIDSSTLMNKGLEVIEAMHLFQFSPSQIEVVVHPQSIIHSMIECHDGGVFAQMSPPDMRLPIQYALTYPTRAKTSYSCMNWKQMHQLEFYPSDTKRFRCLHLAQEAAQIGMSMPAFMNAANEVLVHRFLKKKIHWNEISQKLDALMQSHEVVEPDSIEHVVEIDSEARVQALEV